VGSRFGPEAPRSGQQSAFGLTAIGNNPQMANGRRNLLVAVALILLGGFAWLVLAPARAVFRGQTFGCGAGRCLSGRGLLSAAQGAMRAGPGPPNRIKG